MRYILGLLIFISSCNQQDNTNNHISDCNGFLLADSILNKAGILKKGNSDTIDNSSFESFITKFDPYKYDYDKDTLSIRDKNVYLYSGATDYFDSTARQDIHIDNQYLTIYHNLGFGNINHIFVVWDKCDSNKLKFNTILDLSLNESIGSILFREIQSIGKNEYLIIGDSGGGDAGDTWGSLWIAKWKRPRHLRLLYEERYSTNYSDDGIDRRKFINYHLDINRLEMDIVLKESLKSERINRIDTIFTKHLDLKN